jgi:hypothetical protein
MLLGDDEIFERALELPDDVRDLRVLELCQGDSARAARILGWLSGASALNHPPGGRDPDRKLPCRLGPYTLLQEIGRGAHGVVYRAEHGDVPAR